MPSTYRLSSTQQAAVDVLVRTEVAVAEAERRRVDAALRCRGVGVTWEQIGDALGITRQAAWERFSRFARDDLA